MKNDLDKAVALYHDLEREVHAQIPSLKSYTFALDLPSADQEILNQLVSQICEIYLRLTSIERDSLRKIFKDQTTSWYLCVYTNEIANDSHSHLDTKTFRLGLAALSINDQTPDYRDWLYAVGYLIKAARDSSLPNYLDIVKEVGQLSSSEGTPESTRTWLLEFEKTAVYRELVK